MAQNHGSALDLRGPHEAANVPLDEDRCEHIIDGLPPEWYGWPLDMHVSFEMLPHTGLSGRLFEEYKRYTMEQALEVVFDERNRDAFIGYRFGTRDFVPAYKYYASWPLFRRGRDEPHGRGIGGEFTGRWLARGIEPRTAMGGAAPWEWVMDNTVFRIWREPVTVWGLRSVFMLRVGGRDQKDARRNWQRCAAAIRAYQRWASRPSKGRTEQ